MIDGNDDYEERREVTKEDFVEIHERKTRLSG